MYEKRATPIKRIPTVISLSEGLFGLKSPNPTVERVVKAK